MPLFLRSMGPRNGAEAPFLGPKTTPSGERNPFSGRKKIAPISHKVRTLLFILWLSKYEKNTFSSSGLEPVPTVIPFRHSMPKRKSFRHTMTKRNKIVRNLGYAEKASIMYKRNTGENRVFPRVMFTLGISTPEDKKFFYVPNVQNNDENELGN